MYNIIKYYTIKDDNDKVAIPVDLVSLGKRTALVSTRDPPDRDFKEIGEQIDLSETKAEAERIIAQAKQVAEDQLRVVKNEKQHFLQDAMGQIQEWWEQRRTEDEHIRNNLFERTRTEAYAQALKDAEMKIAIDRVAAFADIEQLFQEAHRVKIQAIQAAETWVVELAIAIATKILHKQLMNDPAWMLPYVEEAHHAVQSLEQPVHVRVHPTAFALVQQQCAQFPAQTVIVPDGTLRPNGCRIQSVKGTLDVSLEPQLQALKETLLRVVDEGGETN